MSQILYKNGAFFMGFEYDYRFKNRKDAIQSVQIQGGYGNPGVGKTTSIIRVARAASNSNYRVGGFFTEECRDERGNRMGFDFVCFPFRDDNSEKRAPLARSGRTPPCVGKYSVNVENVRNIAIPSIKNVSSIITNNTTSTELLVIDEMGKMELLCPDFFPAVEESLNKRSVVPPYRLVIGTIPIPRSGRIIAEVEHIRSRADVTVLYLTKENRESVSDALEKAVLQALQHIDQAQSVNDNVYIQMKVRDTYETYLHQYILK